MPGMGAYPSDAPLSLGLCGYAGSQYANMAMYKSDLLIGIGTTFHLRQTGSLPAKTVEKGRIARIDLDINELRHSRVPLDMNIQELATIVERGIDIKIVVLDNHALSIVAQFQRQNWKSHPSTGDKYNPDFAAIAQAYGIAAVSITSTDGMADKFRFALNCKGPVLIHCQVDPEEDLLPMLLGGHTLDDRFHESSF